MATYIVKYSLILRNLIAFMFNFASVTVSSIIAETAGRAGTKETGAAALGANASVAEELFLRVGFILINRCFFEF